MECPYCKREMEKGLIQSPQDISWIKGNKRKFFRGSFYQDSVVLSQYSFLKGSAVTAFLCRDCQKVIIDHSYRLSDFNNR